MKITLLPKVKWQFKSMDQNVWVEKEILVKMGYLKLVQREDERQAAMAGLMTKQLTQPGVEKHLADFGVDAESASHTQINQLSGGMKVKVVLAAAMWQNPHVPRPERATRGAATADSRGFSINFAWILEGVDPG